MNIVESSYQFFHKNNHFLRPLLPSGSGCVAPSLSRGRCRHHCGPTWLKAAAWRRLQPLKTAAEVATQTMTQLIE